MRCFSLLGLSGAALALSIIASPISAARLFLDSRPTDTGPTDQCADLSLRELPRQTLIVIANDELGVDVVDASLEPQVKPQPGDIQIGLDRELTKAPQILKVSLFDAADKLIEKFEIPCVERPPRFVELTELAKQLDDETFRSKWRALLATQLSVTEPKPTKWNPTLPTLEGMNDRLNTIDFTSAFMAVRLIHAAIADSGASPARLGSLVRAYANLGESTRELISGQSAAMFARSYVYAQRLIRLAPQDPMSWYSRAYAEALHGMISEALADLKHGDELANGAMPPTWVQLVQKLLVFDTPGLYRDGQAEGGALASYFAWRTVEHSSLQGLVINFAKLALQNNAGALRIVNSIGGNSSIGYSGQAASKAPQILDALVAGMAASKDAPQAVSDAVRPAEQARFSIPTTLTMLSALDAIPRESGQLMPWPAFAALIREWNFLNAIRSLAFGAYMIGPNASAEARQIYPLVKDHRYALVVATFDRTNQLAGADGVEKLHQLPVSDDTLASLWTGFNLHFYRMGVVVEPKRQMNWLAHASAQCDHTAYDWADILWMYRNGITTPSMSDTRRKVASELEIMAPNHPVALAWQLMEDWPAVQDRADQIERDYSDNPMIAYALGQAYATLKRYDRAVPLLEKALQFAPDKPVFKQLADIYLARGDEDKWLATWDRYFKESEDTGLDHAMASRDIAVILMHWKEMDKAIPYAQQAAETGSEWGYEIYGTLLTKMGQYDEAHHYFQNIASRYGPIPYYRWCRQTGKGDLAAATRLMQQFIPQIDQRGERTQLVDAAAFYYTQGDLTKATQYLERAYHQEKESYIAMLLALNRLEQKRPEDARRLIDEAIAMPANSPRLRAYATGAAEMKHFLDNPQVPPSKLGNMTKVLIDPDMITQRGNVCYMLGKLCEIERKTDAAKMWYRLTLDTASPGFVGLGLAGDALRKLGDEYYK